MNWKRNFTGILAAIGLFVLIIDGRLALEGARSGIDLCIKTVIPSLFPFFVLSMILTNTLGGSNFFLRMIARGLGISKNAAPVLIPSVLGGYPVGAKCVSDLYARNQIGKSEAERLLAFCSNAGPSFLFGMVSGFFPENKMVWMLWLIQIFCATLTAAVISAKHHDHQEVRSETISEQKSLMLSATKAMGLVCCWVILFRIIISFLNSWFLWMLPAWVQVLMMGLLELTNGCCELLLITNVKLRFVLCACMLSFGGICVLLQTASVIKGLSLGHYVKGKLIQTAFTFLLSSAVVVEQGWILLASAAILVMVIRKMQKRYSNPWILPV